jgi:hypothetical protein
VFAAWAATALTTLALSAWVTLAIVQVALRSGNFEMYGRPAFYAIHSQFRILCFHTCKSILRPSDKTNALLNSIFHGSITELPPYMNELIEMLVELSNQVDPSRARSLTPVEASNIRSFCDVLNNWWSIMEPMLVTAGANALRRETVPAIHTYRHNIIFWRNGINDILERTGDEALLIDLIRNITNENRKFYNIILAELGPYEC